MNKRSVVQVLFTVDHLLDSADDGLGPGSLRGPGFMGRRVRSAGVRKTGPTGTGPRGPVVRGAGPGRQHLRRPDARGTGPVVPRGRRRASKAKGSPRLDIGDGDGGASEGPRGSPEE